LVEVLQLIHSPAGRIPLVNFIAQRHSHNIPFVPIN
jgi:hypothetical protein